MSDPLSPRLLLERPMPAGAGAQLDVAAATLGALLEEQHRLERLGFELPLARCHQQIRYWGFVARLLEISAAGAAGGEARCASDPR